MKKKLVILDYDGVIVHSFSGALAEFFLELKRRRLRNKNPMGFLKFITSKLVLGIDNTIKSLYKNGYLVSIVSSNRTKIIKRSLKRNNLEKYICQIIGRGQRLTKREKIITLLTNWKCERSRTFHVGDTVGDDEEAKEAGVKSVLVSWGYHKKEYLIGCSPDALVDKPEELIEVISKV